MAVIAHVDLDAFYASVEQRDHPEWRGKPVIVGSAPDERGVVSTCSYEARAFGVRSAMPSRTAYQHCPHGIFVRPRMEVYREVSKQVFDIFSRYSPFVEPVSVDEAYIDITGSEHLFGGAERLGIALREDIRREVAVTASVGIACNRLLAKLGSEDAKPDGLKIMPSDPEEIAALLAPRPIGVLWGVGKKTAAQLASFALRTCGDVQRIEPATLERLLGARTAEALRAYAFGIASDCVAREEAPAKSVSRENTFLEDTSDREAARREYLALVEDVGMRLRSEMRFAGVARIRIRNADFSTSTRQHRFDRPVRDDISIRAMALRLFDEVWPEETSRTIRLIGFGLDDLSDRRIGRAPDLFAAAASEDELLLKRERLSETVDKLRQRGYTL